MWRLLIQSGIAPPSVRGPAVCPCICQGIGLLLPSLWWTWCLAFLLCHPNAHFMLVLDGALLSSDWNAEVPRTQRSLSRHVAQDDWRMPGEAGVAFLDVGFGHPGTHLSAFSSQTFQAWVPGFYARLAAHMQRAAASVGCACTPFRLIGHPAHSNEMLLQ